MRSLAWSETGRRRGSSWGGLSAPGPSACRRPREHLTASPFSTVVSWALQRAPERDRTSRPLHLLPFCLPHTPGRWCLPPGLPSCCAAASLWGWGAAGPSPGSGSLCLPPPCPRGPVFLHSVRLRRGRYLLISEWTSCFLLEGKAPESGGCFAPCCSHAAHTEPSRNTGSGEGQACPRACTEGAGRGALGRALESNQQLCTECRVTDT